MAAPVPPFLWSNEGSFDSPVTYTVPGAGEVQPYTATATYDNNSGQEILPALRLKSASGNLLALVFPDDTIGDGSSDEVSFVPPFGSAAVSSTPAPPATSAVWCLASDNHSTLPVGLRNLSFSDGLITDSPSVFQITVLAGLSQLQINQTGWYVFNCATYANASHARTGYITGAYNLTPPSHFNGTEYEFGSFGATQIDNGGTNDWLVQSQQLIEVVTAPLFVVRQIQNNTNGAISFTYTDLFVRSI